MMMMMMVMDFPIEDNAWAFSFWWMIFWDDLFIVDQMFVAHISSPPPSNRRCLDRCTVCYTSSVDVIAHQMKHFSQENNAPPNLETEPWSLGHMCRTLATTSCAPPHHNGGTSLSYDFKLQLSFGVAQKCDMDGHLYIRLFSHGQQCTNKEDNFVVINNKQGLIDGCCANNLSVNTAWRWINVFRNHNIIKRWKCVS